MIILLLALAALVGGVVAAGRLNVEMMPDLNFPVVTTVTAYPGASPEDVADQVTKPIERAIAGTQGLKRLQSTSAEGISIVVAQFDVGGDTHQAESAVQSALAKISLPQGAQPPRTARVNFNDLPVVQIGLSGGDSPSQLRQFASNRLVPAVSKVDGVFSVDVLGGEQQAVDVVLDVKKAAEMGISFQQVAGALQANSLAIPAGSVDSGGLSIPVRTLHQFQSLDEIGALVVGAEPAGPANRLASGAPGAPPQAGSPGPAPQTGPPGGATQAAAAGGTPGSPTSRPPAALSGAPPAASQPSPAQRSGTPQAAPPTAAQAPSAQSPTVHDVVSGDTLSDLAQRYGTTVEAIARANDIANPDLIYPDQKLVIPQPPASPRRGPIVPASDPSGEGTVLAPAPSEQAQPTPIKLKEIASVALAPLTSADISRTNGRPSVLLMVNKTQDANAVSVARDVARALDGLSGEMPYGMRAQMVDDESVFVEDSVRGLAIEGLLGMVFAVMVIFAFLRSSRGTLIAGMSIPLSIAIAFLALKGQGLTLNIMTLSGLAVAVGRVVDDSIVVLENAHRHVQRGETPAEAARTATAEVAVPIAASTATTVAVFLPLGLVGGIIGQAFRPFALTIAFALLASLLVALTVVPVLCRLLLRPGRRQPSAVGRQRPHPDASALREADEAHPDILSGGDEELPLAGGEEAMRRLTARDTVEAGMPPFPARLPERAGNGTAVHVRAPRLLALYTPVLRAALRHPRPTLLVALTLLAASLSLVPRIPTTFLPSEQEKLLMIQVAPPPGASRDAVSRKAAEVEKVLSETPGVTLYQTSIGDEGGALATLRTGLSGQGVGSATVLVRLEDEADLAGTLAGLRDSLGRIQGDYRVSVSARQSAGMSRMDLVVSGDDPAAVEQAAQAVEKKLNEVRGLANVASDRATAVDQIAVQVDPSRAAALGLTTAQLGASLRGMLTGQTVGRLQQRDGGDDLEIRLSVPAGAVDSPGKLSDLPFGAPKTVPLSQLAKIQREKKPAQITRVGQKPAVEVTADISATDTGAVSRDVQRQITSLDLPTGTFVDYGGVMQQMSEGFSSMALGQAVGVVLVFLTMVIFFNSAVDPLVILLSLPLAAVGALPALYITGHSLSMSGMIGMLMLIGIVVTNAIVLLDFARRSMREGHESTEALLEAGRIRLRPILMTALTTILALAPLALGMEKGSIIASELALVVMGGLLSSTFLTLLVVPAAYSLVSRRRRATEA